MLSEKSISGAVSAGGKGCITPAERMHGPAASLLIADLINLTDAFYCRLCFRGNTERTSNGNKSGKSRIRFNG